MSVVRAPSWFLVEKLLVTRPLAGFAAGLAVTVLAIALLAPARPAPPPPREVAEEEAGALAQLELALAEADANCERSERPGALPAGRPAFETAELRRALEENPLLLAAEQGELPALLRESRWLATLSPEGAGLGPRRSWEDARFLLGFFRWYLDCAHAAAARRGPGAPERARTPRRYDPARLVAFRGYDFQSLLGAFD